MTSVKDFTPVTSITADQIQLLRDLAEAFSLMAEVLIEELPDGPHKSTSLRKLLEAKMFASQSVTHTVAEPALTNSQIEAYLQSGQGSFYLSTTVSNRPQSGQ
jgi:hypothetical protein